MQKPNFKSYQATVPTTSLTPYQVVVLKNLAWLTLKALKVVFKPSTALAQPWQILADCFLKTHNRLTGSQTG